MTEEESLDLKYQELVDHLKKEGFNLYYSPMSLQLEDEDSVNQIEWDNAYNWKDFFQVAKNESSNLIVVTKMALEEEALELTNLEIEETENDGIMDNLKSELKKISKYTGKIGAFRFSWYKDGVQYFYEEKTPWYIDFINSLYELKSERIRLSKLSSPSMSRSPSLGVPASLKDMSEEETAEEMLKFIVKESPNPSTRDLYSLMRMYWNSKGVNTIMFNPELDFLRGKVETRVRKSIEEEQAKQEKEKLPNIIEDCVKWSKENGLSKVTKSDIKAFLAEKEIVLSKNGENILYQRANLNLKT